MTETAEQKIARYETVLDAYMSELDKLRAENERLRTGADAHTTLQAIYRDPEASQGNRIKAASGALPFEKPKLLSVVSSTEPSRFERWRAYARYQRRTEIVIETGRQPAPGWDLELTAERYVAPDGDAEPPMDLYGRDAIRAAHDISTLVRLARRNGNTDDTDNSDN
jgi:hypothetical protein